MITIYTRQNCHLCDEAKAVIDGVIRRLHSKVIVEAIDIDTDDELRTRFDQEVPVVFIDGRKTFKYRVDAAKLTEILRRGTADP